MITSSFFLVSKEDKLPNLSPIGSKEDHRRSPRTVLLRFLRTPHTAERTELREEARKTVDGHLERSLLVSGEDRDYETELQARTPRGSEENH